MRFESCTKGSHWDGRRAAQDASLAANKNISDQKKLVRDNYSSDLRRFKTVSAMMKLIADHNAPIAQCFFKGKAMDQRYAWLEANLVFNGSDKKFI